MRYFAELAYKGSNYCGWQRQPNAMSVQQTIEEAFSTILNSKIVVTGCGRTDTGVHASQYFLHFDFGGKLPDAFVPRLNKFLPRDIAIFHIFEVDKEAHARFDAVWRSYEYHLCFRKDPFATEHCYFFPFSADLDYKKLQQAADLLLAYKEFFPFCKSNTDVKTMRCELKRSEWVIIEEKNKMVFHISADRFLRGMVRLIVGMCLNAGLGKLDLEDVKEAMDKQVRLKKSLSVPPEGLFLTEVMYEGDLERG